MIVNPLVVEAIDAQVSPLRGVIYADPIVEATSATPAIFRVEPSWWIPPYLILRKGTCKIEKHSQESTKDASGGDPLTLKLD